MPPAKEKNKLIVRIFPGGNPEFRTILLDHTASPHSVALGFAIGIYVGLTPTIPFHTFLCISLAFIFRASKVGAFSASWIANPLTIPAFYYASYKIGGFIWGFPIVWHPKGFSIHEIVSMGWNFALEMITGGLVFGLLPSVITYFIIRKLIIRFRNAPSSEKITEK